MPKLNTMNDVAKAQPPLGPRIRVARENAGMTVEDVARRVGVEPSSVRAWEADTRAPRANRLQMLAGVLNVSLAWLLLGREDRHMERDGASGEALRQRVQRARMMLAQASALLEETEADLAALDDEDGPDDED